MRVTQSMLMARGQYLFGITSTLRSIVRKHEQKKPYISNIFAYTLRHMIILFTKDDLESIADDCPVV